MVNLVVNADVDFWLSIIILVVCLELILDCIFDLLGTGMTRLMGNSIGFLIWYYFLTELGSIGFFLINGY